MTASGAEGAELEIGDDVVVALDQREVGDDRLCDARVGKGGVEPLAVCGPADLSAGGDLVVLVMDDLNVREELTAVADEGSRRRSRSRVARISEG